jgi:hypothetical protein
MKKSFEFLFAIAIYAIASMVSPLYAQDTYKHPHLDASGHVLDSTATKLGWITKEGTIYNVKGKQVGKIEKHELLDSKGHRLGKIGKDGSFTDSNGVTVFTIESGSKGEQCKILDTQGKVIATVHDSYKNQACAIHCLYMKKAKN